LADVAGFEARAQTAAGKGRWRGLGVASFLEWTGGNVFTETVNVQILVDGTVEVFTAVMPMGQGIQTSLTQLVADVFDLPAEKIRVVMGDTDRGNGFGSAGSRSIFTGGGAVSEGSARALETAKSLAAEALETAVEDLTYAQARFTVKGTDITLSLAELAQKQAEQRIVVESSTTAGAPTWPNGCHVCEVEINPETGECEVVAYSSVNDVGRVISPTIVRGQLDGGAVQGIGQALYENLIYETHGAQLISGSLMDYAVPHADVMQVDFVTEMDESVPCKTNVLGVKGVGELGTIGATPAVVNAIADALARNGHGHKTPQLQMPLTPLNLWRTIHEQ
jgi:carbon-monoxide dehydrogenase large subunit